MSKEVPVKTILFVCTANICRSPMAAGLMKREIADRGLADQVEVVSAGVFAVAGDQASDHAIAVLGERGVSLEGHRSQPVTPELLKQADIALVMAESHRRSLFYMAPGQLGKVFLLSEMAGSYDDVADPYGGPIEGYIVTADLLEKLIESSLPGILKRIGVEDRRVANEG